MIKVLSGVWPLLIGIVFIMLGNGMHFTLIGLRGGNWLLSPLAILSAFFPVRVLAPC